MAGRRLTYPEAAQAIRETDPLTDVRLSLGWATVNGVRLPVLRASSKSTIDYRAKAKPMGTVYPRGAQTHAHMLFSLALAMDDALNDEEQAASK